MALPFMHVEWTEQRLNGGGAATTGHVHGPIQPAKGEWGMCNVGRKFKHPLLRWQSKPFFQLKS